MKLPIVIIGTGLAGYTLARELRRIDQKTPLTLITADDGHYYPKPQLSTALTQGKTSDSLITADAEAMAMQLHATIVTKCPIETIDLASKAILIREELLHFQSLVLACGAEVIKPQLKGDSIRDVLSINHIYHYATFQEFIKNKKTIAILGAGLIGSEFANDLSNAGYKVHIIAPAKSPLDLLVPEDIGKILQTALEQNGVTFHLNCVANRIDKISHGYNLELSNGNELEVEFVLSAIGLKPHIHIAEKAHIKTNRGILVNRYLETSSEHVYALGDCAEVEGHVLPYIAPLLNCAKALAKTLSGEKTPVLYPAMPVLVKTPAHPIAVCPPPKDAVGNWVIETKGTDTYALFYDQKQQLTGFVLTNGAVKERASYAKQLPSLI